MKSARAEARQTLAAEQTAAAVSELRLQVADLHVKLDALAHPAPLGGAAEAVAGALASVDIGAAVREALAPVLAELHAKIDALSARLAQQGQAQVRK